MDKVESKVLPKDTPVIIRHRNYRGINGTVVRFYGNTLDLNGFVYVIEFNDTTSTPYVMREMAMVEGQEFDVVTIIPVVKPVLADPVTKEEVDKVYAPKTLIENRINNDVYTNTAYEVGRNEVITKQNRDALYQNYRLHEADLSNLFKSDVVNAYNFTFDIDKEYLERVMENIWGNRDEDDTLEDIIGRFQVYVAMLDGFKVVKG